MHSPLVTVIVATYNRPDGLRWAIASVLNQTFKRWRMLVIGDACGPETAETVESFADPRIRFVNLAERCGEQSGPNSVGMSLVDSDYLAFLNHDDIWMADHLDIGLALLAKTGADFFAGRAAFAHPRKLVAGLPMFTEVSPERRLQADAFSKAHYLFEPCSAWLLRRAAAKRIGPWRSALELHRSPAEDWIMRSWRGGLKLTSDQHVTVLKLKSSAIDGAGKPTYETPSIDLSPWVDDASDAPDSLRIRIASDIDEAGRQGLTRDFSRRVRDGIDPLAQGRALTTFNARLYRWTGWDAYDRLCDRSGLERGDMLRRSLANRTGEGLGPRPDLGRLIEAARAGLSSG